MAENPLQSLTGYSRFVAELLDRSSVLRSTVAVWSASRYTGISEGESFLQTASGYASERNWTLMRA